MAEEGGKQDVRAIITGLDGVLSVLEGLTEAAGSVCQPRKERGIQAGGWDAFGRVGQPAGSGLLTQLGNVSCRGWPWGPRLLVGMGSARLVPLPCQGGLIGEREGTEGRRPSGHREVQGKKTDWLVWGLFPWLTLRGNSTLPRSPTANSGQAT